MNDYIKREDAAKILLQRREFAYNQDWPQEVDLMELLCERLDEIPAADKDSEYWIPVTERLPFNRQTVLCYSDIYDVNQAIALSTKNGMIFVDPCEEYFEYSCVTHWMPLPEPPKEGERETK